ncbi:hypothetical protein H8S37_04655 [Mediterraneibacter sp. NSJ-55]|uniref:Uncharacterized protein n=1 Tax=Mediterraneibacter hominis TaxID=2763054 RepID=A0A923LH67_9FIRM|nr:hypothetical protein [Mediterraneibacter hominis]
MLNHCSSTLFQRKLVILISKNEGKLFEDDFKKSIPDYCWFKRLNDNAASFSGGTNTRFASDNECDFLLFDTARQKLLPIELKSTQSSFSFWREDFENNSKKHTFQIKKNQIVGLQKWSKYSNVICGFILNFRNKNNATYFVNIKDFLQYTSTLLKKSINYNDVLQMNPVNIENDKKRTRYRYNIDNFLLEVCCVF